jgi:hypothetical protein
MVTRKNVFGSLNKKERKTKDKTFKLSKRFDHSSYQEAIIDGRFAFEENAKLLVLRRGEYHICAVLRKTEKHIEMWDETVQQAYAIDLSDNTNPAFPAVFKILQAAPEKTVLKLADETKIDDVILAPKAVVEEKDALAEHVKFLLS